MSEGSQGPQQVTETEAEYLIENPVTGERIRFLEEPTPGGGDVLRFEFWARSHIAGPAAHVHPKQTEYFEVRSGVLSARVGKEGLTLGPGESMTVPKGTPHTWWNSGDEELHGYVELTPSMNMRDEFEAFFALGRAGRTNEQGLPNLLQLAVILDTYPDTIYRAGVPVPLQKLGVAMLAPLARMLGYKARYPEIVGAEDSEVA